MAELTDNQKDLIGFIEQYWTLKKAFPPDYALEKYGKSVGLTLDKIMQLIKSVATPLENRGINVVISQVLSNEQLAAINLVTNYADKRSTPTKLNSLGVTVTKWKGWLHNPQFKSYYENQVNAMFGSHIDAVNTGLLKAAENGNTNAARFIYELTGKYTGKNNNANVQVLIVQIIEVIQRHVSNPEILRSIATDFEMLLLKNQVQQGAFSNSTIEGEIESQEVQPREIEEKATPSKLSPALANRRSNPDDLFG